MWLYPGDSRKHEGRSRVGLELIKAVLMIHCYCLLTQSCLTLL